MKSVILIKSLKKYENYNMSVNLENIMLTGYKGKGVVNKKVNTHYLVKKTCKLGKTLYEIIKEAEKEYTHRSFDLPIQVNDPSNHKTINEKIRNYIDEFKSITDKNHTHYLYMFDFYEEAYNLLKQYKKAEFNELILIPSQASHNINKALIDHYESCGEKPEILNEIDKDYNTILNKILDILDEYDCSSLINKINYIPFTIRYFFDRILINGNGKDNKEAVKIFEAIENWCQEFGMPFWTERKKIGKYTQDMIITTGELVSEWKKPTTKSDSYSLMDWANNTVPINGLITISIVMYLLYSLWEEYVSLKEISDNKQKDLDFLKSTMGSCTRDIVELIEQADKYHNYIMNNFNTIGKLKLEINEKKIAYTKNYNTIFKNGKEYESSAIAAWDIFYHDYLGNLEINNPLPYCDICQKEIGKKVHTIETGACLCDNCFAKRRSLLNRERVSRSRNNRKEKNEKYEKRNGLK